MQRFWAGYLLRISEEMHTFAMLDFNGMNVTWDQKVMTECVQAFIRHANELDLPVSSAAASRFLNLLERHAAHELEAKRNASTNKDRWFGLFNKPEPSHVFAKVEPKDFAGHAKMVLTSLRDELNAKYVFSISQERSRFYEQKEPLFGAIVAAKFPRLSDEISEAGKCYALHRPTASVFHSIRCLEAGITGIARCLSIPDPTKGSDRSWAIALRNIEKEIDRRWPKGASRFSGDGEVFEKLHAILSAIQNPYRNATMHLDAKYTDEQALDIFNAVRRLMNTIAQRMYENGEPKA